jgi:ABC-type nitrate/sulfonate/bicarbonate transport system substrate-binding protein
MTTQISAKPDALWYTRCSVPTPLSIAVLNGAIHEEFQPDGIEIKSLRDSTDPAELASHYEHSLPHSFRQGGSVPAIWTRSKGTKTKVIALSWTDEFQAIIALPTARIQTVKDLKGRRIGVPKHAISVDHNRASSLRAFSLLLAADGLSLADVEQIDLLDADEPQTAGVSRLGGRRGHSYRTEALALARGQVDAIYVKDVRGLEVINLLGAQIVADIGFHPDTFLRISNCTPRPLTVNEETLAIYPDLVTRFLGRVVAGGQWAAAHPNETVTRISQETGWSERAVRQSFGDQVHLHLGADLSDASIQGLGAFKDYLFQTGVIPNDFSITDWIDAEPLSRLQSLAASKVA